MSVVVSGDFCRFKLTLPSLFKKTGITVPKMAEIARTYDGHTGCEKVLLILRVKCSYFEIFIVVNRPYFVPDTIPYNVFKFLTVPPVT